MAGEWIKFEASTPEKREVFAITAAMGWDDPDLTVGKLLKVWRWFDQQTVDGNAPSVTSALLDRIIGVSGFAQAMRDVGWLVADDAGLSLPNFERHNGATAKNRALTAKRVALHKANAKGNAEGNGASVSGALPKEEKRREEDTSLSGAAAPDAEGSGEIVIERRKVRRGSDADYECAEFLFKQQRKANPQCKAPNFDTWANDIRLMREQDGRQHRDICELYKWAKADDFWSPNIQSPAKLREKWDMLFERRTKESPPAAPAKKDWI